MTYRDKHFFALFFSAVFKKNSLIRTRFFNLLLASVLTSLVTTSMAPQAFAQDEAQTEDNYDPFSDYSEFTEASAEEADINFFRNGRLLSLGLLAGGTSFLGNYSDVYSPAPVFGAFINYFFDLQFALQVGMTTSDHDFSFTHSTGQFNAKMRLFDIHFYGKYFFNTQNMTRAFADWNPYLLGGVSQVNRSHSSSTVVRSSDNAVGFDVGAGVEYMFNSKKNFVGLMFLYQYISFPGEGKYIPEPDGSAYTRYKQSGDPFSIMGTIGINF